MRKDALTITITTTVLGIFGAFFRWLQTLNAFEKESGLPIPGAGTSVAFVVYTIAAVAALAVMTWLWLRDREASAESAVALRTETVFPLILSWLLAAVMAIAALILMFSAEASRSPFLQRATAATAILAAAGLPFLLGKKGSEEANPMGALASLMPVLLGCIWIVFSYKVNSESPVVWAYGVEILAIAATTLAFYYIVAYHYNQAKPVRTIFTVQLAVLLNMSTFTDDRSAALTAIFAVCTAMLLLLEFVMIRNLQDKN